MIAVEAAIRHEGRDDTPYETLAVVVRLVWSGDGSCIFVGRDEWTRDVRVVATDMSVDRGEAWRLLGSWREHEEHGWQLHVEATNCVRVPPPHPLLSVWLTQFDGVGPHRAKAILAAFGSSENGLEDAFGGSMVIERLAAAIAPDKPFMAATIATKIVARWSGARSEYQTLQWLEEVGIVDASLARKLVNLIGPEARDLLDKDPYVLAAVLPWHSVDLIGRKILSARGVLVAHACCRCVGAVQAVLRERLAEGHTAVPKSELLTEAMIKLDGQLRPARRPNEREKYGLLVQIVAERHGAVLDGGDVWRNPGCAIMEDEIERWLQTLMYEAPAASGDVCWLRPGGRSNKPLRSCPSSEPLSESSKLEGKVVVPARRDLAFELGTRLREWPDLADEQREAVLSILERPVAVLTGGAGVGKTTTCRAVCDAWELLGGRLELCALSGKAALRLGQATGRETRTVFRLLRDLEIGRTGVKAGGKGSVGVVGSTAGTPLDNRTLLVVDEASMIDLASMHRLVEEIVPGGRLLLVGDPFQLPPVGFGMPFVGLADDPAVFVKLLTVRRQTEVSGIPAVARGIRKQRRLFLERRVRHTEGVSWQEILDESELPNAIDEVVGALGGFSQEAHRLIVVTATNQRGPASALQVNLRHHMRLRDASGLPEVKGQLGQWFSPGDPVVSLINDYERELYNGSLGHVVRVNLSRRSLTVVFENREVDYSPRQLLDLSLAYALTCHRLQGSQAKRIVIPITRARPENPSWLYTAVTRAELQAVLVGRKKDIDAILERPVPREYIRTKLLRVSTRSGT